MFFIIDLLAEIFPAWQKVLIIELSKQDFPSRGNELSSFMT